MNITQKLSFIFLLLSFLSCQKKPTDLPLPEDKLVRVLMDLHLAEGAFHNLSTSSKDTLAFQYYDQVYQMHEVEKAQVDSCIAILNRRPEQYFEIYEKVKTNLEEEARELR